MPKINNWVEQEKYYGLDYSNAIAKVGDYTFDIRYDHCSTLFKNDLESNKCNFVLNIKYNSGNKKLYFEKQ